MKFKKVVIRDYSEFEPGRCNNGGAYGYETSYHPAGGEKYVAHHWTTAEFDFCPHCGEFHSNCGRPQLVTETELTTLITQAEQSDNENIEAIVAINDDPDYIRTIRRRAEDALRKGSEENIFKVAALLGVNLA